MTLAVLYSAVQLSSTLSTSIFLEMAEVLEEVVPMAVEVLLGGVFAALAAASASALATAAATDVGPICFVLLRFRLPETCF